MPNHHARICGSGRQGSWSGVEGSFEIYVKPLNKECAEFELYKVDFVVPFLGRNKLNVKPTKMSAKHHAFSFELEKGDMYGNNLRDVRLIISLSREEREKIAKGLPGTIDY